MSAPPVAAAELRAPVSSRGLLVRGILLNWGSLIIGVLVSFVLTPLMIRGLGQYYYGMWILVMSVSDQYGLLDLGMTAALSRFAGYFKGSKERGALDEIFSLSFLLTLAAAILICGVTVCLAPFLPSFFGVAESDRTTFIRLILLLGVTTAVAFPERMLAAYLRGIQRFDLFNAAATGSTVVRAVLIGLALSLGFKVLVIAVITLTMGAVSFAAHYALVRRADPGLRIHYRNVTRARLREMFGFSIYAFIASLGMRLINRLDPIVIGRILSVGLIAPFNVASRLTDYFIGVFAGVYGPILSAMSELDGAAKWEELRALFLRSSRFTCLLSCLMATVLIVDGRSLLNVWLGSSGLDLEITYQVLVILTLCYAAYQVQLPSRCVIYARARHQLLAWLTLGEGVLHLGLSVYLGRRYGLIGIALATMIPGMIHQLLIVPYYALRVIDMPFRRYLNGLWRPVLACALFVGLCTVEIKAPASLIGIAVVGMCRVVVFGLLAYSVGVTSDERRYVRAYCRRIVCRS
jgi:O-antigen/teichoic acid export membrane protein